MSDPAPHLVAHTDVHREIRRNQWRTALILLSLIVLVLIVGVVVDLLFGLGVAGIIGALVVAVILAAVSYARSDKVALAAAHARPVDEPDQPRFNNLVEGLCIAAGLPKPALYVIDDPAPNTFAVGRNPRHAALAVTTGLLGAMNRVELEGVIAHELSHIKNSDMLASTTAVTAIGGIVLLADLGLRFSIVGGDREEGNGSLGVVLAVAALPLLIFAPIAAQLMRLSMTPERELQADATGVALTRYPPGLASALKKLESGQAAVHHATRATAQLWIESPLERDGEKTSRLNRAFDTHPPLEKRIRILESM